MNRREALEWYRRHQQSLAFKKNQESEREAQAKQLKDMEDQGLIPRAPEPKRKRRLPWM